MFELHHPVHHDPSGLVKAFLAKLELQTKDSSGGSNVNHETRTDEGNGEENEDMAVTNHYRPK